jgi:hypothetical protein
MIATAALAAVVLVPTRAAPAAAECRFTSPLAGLTFD